jgi:hypothetical protein
MFAAPDNPRYPAYWFTMHEPFSFLAATINSYRIPFEIHSGSTASFRYGIAVLDGHENEKRIGRLYRHWQQQSAEN